MKRYFTYIVRCFDGKYYTGVTSNLEKRINQHNISEIKSSYTYSRRPVELVFYEEYDNPHDAISREKQVKDWNRRKKEALIRGDYELIGRFSTSSKRQNK